MPNVTAAEITAKIALLTSLTLDKLRLEWLRLFGSASPAGARQDYLARMIAHRMQADLYGGLSAAASRRLKKLCGAYAGDAAHMPAAPPTFTLGTRILREWQGVMHEAIVVEGGFIYNGQTYKSLSVIARKITGTRWSGPVFFGVKKSLQREPERVAGEPPHGAPLIERLSASRANTMVAEAQHGS